MLSKLIDTGLGIVTGFVSSLFGKSKTRKTLDALQQQANVLAQEEAKQKSLVSIAVIAFVSLAVLFIFLIYRRKR